ncbi:fumarylacetoacetate hydrolase family protein [Henriciella litoralis]|uniref:fumarylacetoacetate hydrolase family protein n=1 Tax=Henriciella litoralis TaxID=568102 RepID=UPI001F44B76C
MADPHPDFDPAKAGERLWAALKSRVPVAPLIDTWPGMTIDEAYAVSLAMLEARKAEGECVVGKKIGVTSKPVQDMLSVHQPDFGFLTDAMHVQGGRVDCSKLIAPRAEAEIAFRLKSDLQGPGVTAQDVLDATESVMACFEIVDSRIRDWKIAIQDTVADNASCGVFVLGDVEADPSGLDLAGLKAVVTKNGQPLSEGYGSAVQGAPENAVAWLANTLGAYGIPFLAGEIILSGSVVPLEPVGPGDVMDVSIDGLGTCHVEFV